MSCLGKRLNRKIRPPISETMPPKVVRTIRLKRFIFWIMDTVISPVSAAQKVAIRIGRNTSAGLAAPSCWRKVRMLTGTSINPAVFSTRNIIIGLDAFSLSGFISCNSFIAFNPSGVAALSRPSILAERFIKMLPIAG